MVERRQSAMVQPASSNCLRASKVDWSMAPKNQISAMRCKPKLNFVHFGPCIVLWQTKPFLPKALNREVEPYGFFLVKALRKYYHALGRGLLPIAPCLFRWKCNQTKFVCGIRKCQNIFSFIKAPFDDLNTFLKCI